MGIFSRLSDIINSNIGSMLDHAEDPEKIIRLMIQEMEDTLIEVRSTAARTIADKKELQRKLSRLEQAQGDWQHKAELALSKGREDLAKAALVERAKLAETARALAEELDHLNDGLARFEEDIAKLEAKLRETKAKQKAIQARQTTASSQLRARRQIYDNRIEDALVRFAQMEKRIDTTESEIEAYELGRRKTLAEEIADLESEAAIEQELEALKARMRKNRGTREGE